jgi:phage baseplate assembly protein W
MALVKILEGVNLIISEPKNTNYKGLIYLLAPDESLSVMIATAKGSRVGRPTFGSTFYKLVDGSIDDIWILRAKKAILECITDENDLLWDDRVDIKKLEIKIDKGKVNIMVELC